MTHFQDLDLADDMTSMLGHRLAVPGRLAMFDRGGRILGHQRPQALLFSIFDQVGELLVDHHKLVAKRAQTRSRLAQLSLDRTLTHRSHCTERNRGPSLGASPAAISSRG